MRHYLAMLWDVENRRAADDVARFQAVLERSGRGWICRLHADGLVVLHLPSERPGFHAYVLPNGSGVVLGQLFTRADEPQRVSPTHPPSLAEAILPRAASVQQLISDYWGSYVAFVRSATHRSVFRDCSGQIPCYRRRCGDIDFVFSDIDDLNALQLAAPSIDWTYLAAFIYFNELQIRDCALDDVTELLAGDCFEWSRAGQRQYSAWNPADLATDRIDDYDDAAQELRRTTQACADAWASEYDDIIHSLSGGFDSTVVLACLAQARSRPNLTCVNRYATNPGEDERYYARIAALRWAAPLVEEEWKAAERAFDERIFATPRTAKPSVPLLYAMLELERRNAIAHEVGASTMTTGQGGDHLFLQLGHPVAAADFLWDRGLTPRLLTVVNETARLAKTSFWSVARSALAYRYLRKQWKSPALEMRTRIYVAAAALPPNMRDYVSHPWNDAAGASSPGRQFQAFLLADLANRHRPLGDLEYAEELHPLISQPLMELYLRIPTYLLARGGRQRALARDAFANEVPREIRNRQDKGAIMGVVLQSIRKSKDFLRELLLEGVLAREQVIDRRELEAVFGQALPMRAAQIYPLVSCIAAEVWAQTWSETARKRAMRTARIRAA